MLCGGLGTQVVGSILRPSGFCGAYGFKPSVGGINRGGSLDYLSQSVTGTIAASLADAWAMARAVADRVGGDPGHPGLAGPLTLPASRRPAQLGLLRTVGWPVLTAPARASLEAALERLRGVGVTVLTPEDCPALAAVEAATAEALQISMGLNAWEWRWPLGSFVERDATVLSASALVRHARSQAMTQVEYAVLLARREAACAAYNALAGEVDAVISVTAPGTGSSAWKPQATRSSSCPARGRLASARCWTIAACRWGCRCCASRKVMRTCSVWRAGSKTRCAGKRSRPDGRTQAC
jgi:Asp-tRNA(Asn)/Glu-tRNA(Gln) amidotransferase A subunit family amidase